MKLIKSLPIVLGLIIGFSSCSDDFLDAEQSNVLTGDELNQLEVIETVKGFLSGGYYILFNAYDIGLTEHHDDYSLKAIHLATDAMCEDMVLVDGFLFDYDYQNDNRALNFRRTRTMWQQMYKIIYQANLALRVLEPLDDEELSSEAMSYKGQALALRGYLYFVLINLYQQPYSQGKDALGIPLRYPIKDNDKPGRNTVGEVYEQILSDLTTAYGYLEETNTSGKVTDPNEITVYTAAGMLAKVLCFVNDYPNQWNEVAKYANIASEGRSLMSKAQLLQGFNSVTLDEVLWGSSINDETCTYFASFFGTIDPMGIGYAPMGYFFCVSSELQDKIDPEKDIRSNWFVTEDDEVSSEDVPMPIGTVLKFRDAGDQLSSDYIYMRTAEMYFINAEALYLAGDEPGARSALEDILTTRIDGYSASSLSGSALLNEIRIQKRIEMWGEGARLFDLKWRGEDMDRTGSTNHVEQYTMQIPAYDKRWVFQIPQKEMDANDDITENNP